MGKLNSFANVINGTYDSIKASPFDARQAVATLADLKNANTWAVNQAGELYYPVYKGLIVSVKDNGKAYILDHFTQENINSAPEFDETSWQAFALGEAVKGDPGKDGKNGITFTPAVSEEGIISWTNDGDLENPMAVSIRGPQGEQGPKGDQGEKGEPGEQGTKGEPGEQGLQGEKGADGANGIDGKSAYEIAKEHGFEDSEEAWLASLKGTDGKDGLDGVKGDTGAAGKSAYEIWLANGHSGSEEDFLNALKGTDGQNGTDGANGKSAYEIWLEDPVNTGKSEVDFLASLKGEKGDTGAQGENGADGLEGKAATIEVGTVMTGEPGTEAIITNVGTGSAAVFNFTIPRGQKGEAGADGKDGKDGTSVNINGSYESEEALKEAVPVGAIGDAYIVSTNLYVWDNTNETWKDVGQIQGPQGEQGPQGPQGPQGIEGKQGLRGATGAHISAVTGDTAPEAGNTVTYTMTNSDGTIAGTFKVINGADGTNGLTAGFGTPTATVDANIGTPSVTITTSGEDTAKVFNFAFKNLKGEKGDTGATGARGPAGSQGSKGDQGLQGIPGPKGDTGEQGIQGLKGDKGEPGKDGLTTAIKVGDDTYTQENGVIELPVTGIPDSVKSLAYTMSNFYQAKLEPEVTTWLNPNVSGLGSYTSPGFLVAGYGTGSASSSEEAVAIGPSGIYGLTEAAIKYKVAMPGKAGTMLLKEDLIDLVYPIGSIYMSVNSINPGTLFGGTWAAWGAGRVPVGVNILDDTFSAAEQTGGEKTHTLTVSEMPKHNHAGTDQVLNTYNAVKSGDTARAILQQKQAIKASQTITSGEEVQSYSPGTSPTALTTITQTYGIYNGEDMAHNNLQPYITCYMWKRIK